VNEETQILCKSGSDLSVILQGFSWTMRTKQCLSNGSREERCEPGTSQTRSRKFVAATFHDKLLVTKYMVQASNPTTGCNFLICRKFTWMKEQVACIEMTGK
jgi:hypothetical protein